MIKLTNKDADKILSYLRDKLSELRTRKKTIEDMRESYDKKDNPLINAFLEVFVEEKDKDGFDSFNKEKFEKDLIEVDKNIDELEGYIYLLTIGSEGV